MRMYHHGTTEEVGRKIAEYGFGSDDKKLIWNCSDPESTYFYMDELDGQEHEGYYRAVENAQIASAFQNSQNRMVAVVTLCIPEGSPLENWVEEDGSCPNMSCEAVCISDEAIQRHWEAGNAFVYITMHKAYEPGFRFLYLANLSEEYLNEMEDKDDIRCLKFAKRIDWDCLFEELVLDTAYDIDLPEYITDPEYIEREKEVA